MFYVYITKYQGPRAMANYRPIISQVSNHNLRISGNMSLISYKNRKVLILGTINVTHD